MNRSSQLRGSMPFSTLAATPSQQSFLLRIAVWTMLLSLTALVRPSAAMYQISPVLAQSAPATAPTPSTAERALPWLWLLLIPLAAGWRWSMVARRSRETANSDPIDPLTVGVNAAKQHQQTPRARLTADRDRQPVDRAKVVTPVEVENNSQQIDAGSVVRVDRSEETTLQLVQELQLLEERLVVDIQRRKVGEIVVRKEIETRIVEVPIRREKLIVEQVSPEFKQLAVIDLGQSSATETVGSKAAFLPTVDAKFTSIVAAVDFLKEIADGEDWALQHVQMNVVLKDRTPELND